MGLEYALWGSVPFVSMVLVECAEVGIATISKVAMRQGMSKLVFLVYYNALGTLLLLPYFIFHRNKQPPLSSHSLQSKWIFGGFLLSINSVVSAVWNIGRAATVKEYPEQMTIVFFYTFFVTIQIFIFSLVVETNLDAWKLKPGIEIVAIVYVAIFVSVLRIGVHVWCLHKKGLVYVAMFKPLSIAIVVVMVVTFLGETLHLGSVIGSVAIVARFYTVIWGQIKEKKNNDDKKQQVRDGSLESSTQMTPFLQTNINKEKRCKEAFVRMNTSTSMISVIPKICPSRLTEENQLKNTSSAGRSFEDWLNSNWKEEFGKGCVQVYLNRKIKGRRNDLPTR